ncbi:DUF4815 domain-containing protein [Roseibium salinum]|nr:DUF4815 domain-containing protein [Roseibium salinum]
MKPCFLTYNSRIPRKDLICFNVNGIPEIIKGISARKGALPPKAPEGLLKVAEIHNTWDGTPTIVNSGTKVATYEEIRAYFCTGAEGGRSAEPDADGTVGSGQRRDLGGRHLHRQFF